MLQDDGMTEDEVETYKKTMLIQKCLQQVKEKGKKYEEARNSPDRYKKTKSKVRMNMKSQQKSRNN